MTKLSSLFMRPPSSDATVVMAEVDMADELLKSTLYQILAEAISNITCAFPTFFSFPGSGSRPEINKSSSPGLGLSLSLKESIWIIHLN